MRIYLRKVFNHDVTHEVSVKTDIVQEFFDNQTTGLRFYKKGQRMTCYPTDINSATDPRFGGKFKDLLRDSGDVNVDDIIAIRKIDDVYDLEIVRPSDTRYSTFIALFPDEKNKDGRDRHQIISVDDSEEIEDDGRKIGAENILLYGVPGVGKSYEIQEHYLKNVPSANIERVVFHPDYSYSDFVGQILPKLKKDEEGNEKLEYAFVPGPFTKMLKVANEKPNEYVFLVIEEINRGNAPAIFGEVFQLLDRKKERKLQSDEIGESEYGITNFEVAKVVYGNPEHEVRIPSNMYILSTMNTADQNVFTLDTAFQRRWNMKHIRNDVMGSKHANQKIAGSKVTWGSFATVVNDIVVNVNSEMASSEDKRLGAYFAKADELGPERFSEKVLKYLWDDAFKFNREELFKPEFKSLDKVIEGFELTDGDRLEMVLRLNVYEKMLANMKVTTDADIQDSGSSENE